MLVARSGGKLEELASEFTDVRVQTVVADLASTEGAGRVLAAVAAGGSEIDILVNNAGVGLYGAFARTPIERELAMVQINIGSLLQLTKGLLPGMLARGRGHIVNVASVAAFVPGPNQSVYYATKAFVRSFSDSLAAELRGTGVAVTAAFPGPVASGFHAAAGVARTGRLYDWFLEQPGTVAEAVYRAVERRAPSVVPGVRHRLLLAVMRVLPRGLVGRVGQAVRR